MNRVEQLEFEIEELNFNLINHRLYKNFSHLDDVKIFMENHVFAVWDFMSLLKSLQLSLTNVKLPWIPSKSPSLARFINEIVLGEESDLNELGQPKSHFEMYLDAMRQAGTKTNSIDQFVELLETGVTVDFALNEIDMDSRVADFVRFSFSIIETNKPHLIAACFTFGREVVIPEMFVEIVHKLETKNKNLHKLAFYLQRHIELDEDEHGPLSREMIIQLCGDDDEKWLEATLVAKNSLMQRLLLWDAISDLIQQKESFLISH